MNIRRQSGTFQFEEYPFSKNVQGIGKICQEVLLLRNFLQTKLQVKSMKNNYYDFYYTVRKSRDDKKIVDDEYENDFINFIDFFTSKYYIGLKDDNIMSG